MIDLTIGKKTYRHPSKIEEVTLRQWIAIQSVEDNEELSHIENNLNGFSAFSGVPVAELKKLPRKKLKFYIGQVYNMIGSVDHTDSEMPKSFKVDKHTFIVNQNVDEAESGQYIGCTHYMNKMNSSPEFYPYMMAIYCLKKGEKPIDDPTELDKRAEIMLDANVLDALKINAFFLNTSQDFLSDSQLYLGEN